MRGRQGLFEAASSGGGLLSAYLVSTIGRCAPPPPTCSLCWSKRWRLPRASDQRLTFSGTWHARKQTCRGKQLGAPSSVFPGHLISHPTTSTRRSRLRAVHTPRSDFPGHLTSHPTTSFRHSRLHAVPGYRQRLTKTGLLVRRRHMLPPRRAGPRPPAAAAVGAPPEQSLPSPSLY